MRWVLLMPDPLTDDKTLEIIEGLREIYTPEGVGIFLFGKHKRWGESALEMIREGRHDEVLQEIDIMASGAFT